MLLNQVYSSGTIYPPREKVFNAIQTTDLADVKVVILGQDPYHGPRQAQGLSFSVPDDIPAPPSLQNILKELADDIGLNITQCVITIVWFQSSIVLV